MLNHRTRLLALPLLLGLSALTVAGGSNYGIAPGARPNFAGKVSEWPVPTPKFARDPAPGPDGNIYISVMQGDRIARFDTKTQQFKEWDLPAGAHPHGLLVDKQGRVWYTGNGNGTIGTLDPATGKVTEHKTPSGGDPHTLVIDDAQKTIWFSVQGGNRLGRLDMTSGKITEYKVSGNPYGVAIDKQGYVWFCEIGGGKIGRLDPANGSIGEIDFGHGSQPRRMAVAPNGTLWVTLYGNGKLVEVDPAAQKVVKEVKLPAGSNGGPYAVTVDGAGIVWVNEIREDSVVRFNPSNGEMKTVKLPSKNVGIRKMSVDAEGRLWYMGSHNGRLGVVE